MVCPQCKLSLEVVVPTLNSHFYHECSCLASSGLSKWLECQAWSTSPGRFGLLQVPFWPGKKTTPGADPDHQADVALWTGLLGAARDCSEADPNSLFDCTHKQVLSQLTLWRQDSVSGHSLV